MECCNRQDLFSLEPNHSYGHKMVSRRLLNRYPPWFDARVFYIRVTNFTADGSTPDHLTLSYFPLGPDAVVTINGGRSSDLSDYCVSAQLRRDRADTRSEEATYVNTDTIRVSGTVGFEVCCGGGDELLLSGVLELSSVAGGGGGGGGGGKSREKKWVLNCESHMTDASARQGCSVFNQGKGQRYAGPEKRLPTVDVYVAGSYAGHPLILTDTLQLFSPRKDHNKAMTMMLDAIPGYESTDKKDGAFLDALQVPEYVDHANKDDLFSTDYEPNSMYSLSEAHSMGRDDGELSWFNAGVRVGVGISLGLCVGVGLGVGLLVSSYQTTARNLKRRFF